MSVKFTQQEINLLYYLITKECVLYKKNGQKRKVLKNLKRKFDFIIRIERSRT